MITWRQRWWLLAGALLTRWPGMVRSPLSDDEAIYAVIARELLRGATLYRDVTDHKPPALYLLYTAMEWLGGSWAFLVIHAATALVVWGTALSLAAIVGHLRPAANGRAAMWTALAYIAFTTTMMPFDGLAANAELWMLLPTVWAVLLMMGQREKGGAEAPDWHAAAAGVLAGIATLFKYQAIVIVSVLVLLRLIAFEPIHEPMKKPISDRVRVRMQWNGILALCAGVLLPFAVWWAHAQLFGDATETAFWLRFNFGYTSAGVATPDVLTRTVMRVAFAIGPAAALYWWGARGTWRLLRQRDATTLVMAVWVLTSAGAVALGGRWFGHYFHQLTAPMAVLVGLAIADGVSTRWLSVTTAVPTIGFWMVAWNTPRVMRAIGDPVPSYTALIETLNGLAQRSATLCVWGNAPLLLEQAQRPLGCRFVSAHFLTGASPATAAQRNAALADQQIVPGMWDRFVQDLDERRPTFIVDLSPGDIAHWGAFPVDRYPALASRLAKSYVPAASVDGAVIYRRR